MKRVLFNPGKMFKRLADPLNISGINDPPAPGPAGPSAADLRASELNAKEEAQRKAQTDAATRAGSASTLLTDPTLGEAFGATGKKKTLLGGA